ncbi:beta-glucosidase [Bacillaceae bacterium SIJ1]|uniref:glycoside hydrolase family 3 N-terminal domain-containing protein n=1 Tax=Litoribacterium kuwaitense TaxID=1398745 RepID=UPI0013ECF7AA|nr:glycoside hydrolase family 3 N-terminal domain-containing protein [Litoribacterium kuwaitense]NGP46490.1 beta-glucosidase [Litoribacterium kuwaitense]
MTLDEKIGQLVQPFGWELFNKNEDQSITLTDECKRDLKEGRIGALYGTLRADPWTGVTVETGLSKQYAAQATNTIQHYQLTHSRLGIPLLFGEECSHGHMSIGATVFPVPLNAASAWNPKLYKAMCQAIAAETRSMGGAATYSPVLDIVRDPRWGRTEETYGEDPHLASVYAKAGVEGLQGQSLADENSIVATLKHFVAYGSSEGGRNSAPVHMGPNELHNIDLPPFKAAVEAGAASLMTAYNEIDGVPCTSNADLLNALLRKEWGFDGFVITDCGAMSMLAHGHRTAENQEDAAAQSVNAGVNMEMSGQVFRESLLNALENKRLTQDALDMAVREVLRVKFRLGLFERPYVDEARAAAVVGSKEHAQVAQQVAEESIILLKNEGQALPLAKNTGSVAVIGPNAHNTYNQLGDYTAPQAHDRITTVFDGVCHVLGEENVHYAPGCRIQGDDTSGFDKALEAAQNAEAVVMVLGGSSARDFGEGTIDLKTGASVVTDNPQSDMDCGEGIDRSTLHLLGVQLELAKKIKALGKSLIVVYMNGRPIVEPWLEENADAILEAWYPGQEGGTAIARILFGDVNPSGRLTLSVPKTVGQLPNVYHYKRTRGKRYLETDLEPLYPFGYGLSYTTFAYGDLKLDRQEMTADETITASIDITNTGDAAGKEVVQLYVTDKFASVTRAERLLKDFQKVELQPGETKTVQFTIAASHLELVTARGEYIVEPGEFILTAGPYAGEGVAATLNVLPS